MHLCTLHDQPGRRILSRLPGTGLGFDIDAGGVFTAAMLCVDQWLVRQRGLATGIASAGSSLGGVIFPFFLDRVIANVGFYGAVRYTALLAGVTLAISCCLLRARLPRKKMGWQSKMVRHVTAKGKAVRFLYSGGISRNVSACLAGGLSDTDDRRWGLWAPFDYISSMAINSGFSSTLTLYLISIIKYFPLLPIPPDSLILTM